MMTLQKKNEGIFQLVIRAVREIDPFLSQRKQTIFWNLAKPEINLKLKRILARNAMLMTDLEYNTEKVNETSSYILSHYLGLGDMIKEEAFLIPQNIIITNRESEGITNKKSKLALEKVETANKLLIKNLDIRMKEALIENLTLLSEINIRLTDLLLMYNYIISINRMLVEGIK